MGFSVSMPPSFHRSPASASPDSARLVSAALKAPAAGQMQLPAKIPSTQAMFPQLALNSVMQYLPKPAVRLLIAILLMEIHSKERKQRVLERDLEALLKKYYQLAHVLLPEDMQGSAQKRDLQDEENQIVLNRFLMHSLFLLS